jgi:hypothetical protein
MEEKIAKIERVFLGREDHGIFTCIVSFNYGNSGQSGGMYALDEPDHESEPFRRRGTAFGMEFVIRLIDAVGVREFSELADKTVIALIDERGMVAGLKPLPTESGKEFIFKDLADEYFEKQHV